MKDNELTPELEEQRKIIVALAKSIGLSFPEIEFLLVSNEELNSIASYGGFPVRYRHWSFGMDYEHLKKGYDYGGSKIYELVINNDPVFAYLMRNNALVDQKLVMAHVCGHADFFHNNFWFKPTNKKMIDQMANNAHRIDRIIDAVGQEQVERFLDICLSVNNLVDPYAAYIKSQYEIDNKEGYDEDKKQPARLPAKDYMDKYINTKDFLDDQRKKIEEASKKKNKFPEAPVRDILAFLVEHSPAARWQKDILGMIREEMYYFVPQIMTKIMNEGWASYIHSKLMTGHLATDSEIIDYCDNHASVMAAGTFNPYKIGLELFRDIEDRWNRGAFGKEYEECDDEDLKRKWNKNLNRGLEKVFQVRKIYNDVTFIDEFLTPEFCAKHQLFVYEHVATSDEYVLATREFTKIKKQFLLQLSNLGNPVITLNDANYQNRGDLFLRHEYDGRELDVGKAKSTLEGIHFIWTRPVYLETVLGGKHTVLFYDGKEHKAVVTSEDTPELEIEIEEDNP